MPMDGEPDNRQRGNFFVPPRFVPFSNMPHVFSTPEAIPILDDFKGQGDADILHPLRRVVPVFVAPRRGGLTMPAAVPMSDHNDATSLSEHVLFGSDGLGHLVKRTRQCRRGVCRERTAVGPVMQLNSTTSKNKTDGQMMITDHEYSFDDSIEATFKNAARQMADAMRHVEDMFGSDGLDDMLNNTFEKRLMERTGLGNEMSPFWNVTMPMWNVTMPDLDSFWNATMPDFGSMWNMTMPNLTSMSNASSSETQSTSIETVVKDGHMIKKTRTCKNGKCNTTTEDKKVVTPKGASVLTQGPSTLTF